MALAEDVVLFPRTAPISAGASASALIDMRGAKRGSVYVPAGWTTADIAFKHQEKSADSLAATGALGTTQAAAFGRKADATLIRITNIGAAAAGWYKIPDEVFCHPGWVKLVSTATGSEAAVNQVSAMALRVSLVF